MTSARRAPELSAMRRMDSCCTMLLGPLHDLGHPPAHRLGERPGLHDPHGVAGPRGVRALEIAGLHLLGPRDLLAVDRVGVAPHQRDRDGLRHLVARHHAGTPSAGRGGRSPAQPWAAFSRRIVFSRAMSRRMARKRIGFSIDSVAERNRRLKRSLVSSSILAFRSSTDISLISLAFTVSPPRA